MSLKAEDVPGFRMYYEDDLVYGIYLFILFGLVAVVVTLYKLSSHKTTRLEKYLLLVAWAIIPPVWFVVEYFFVFLPHGIENSFKYFDYGQAVASKLWGAMSALIALVIYRDAEKVKEDKEERNGKEDGQDKDATG